LTIARASLGLRQATTLLAVFVAIGTSSAAAQTWRISAATGAEVTFTNNVNLAPPGARIADWVTQLTPSIAFDEAGAHSRLTGTVSVPVLLYARTSENNYVAPEAHVKGTLEAIDRFFFIDAAVNVSQQYQNPFGPQPATLVNATQNRYTAQAYTVSPYIKGEARDGVDYELRQTNIWSDANLVTLATSRSYTNEVSGHVARKPAPAGWSLEFDRSDVKFENEASEVTEISRLRGRYQAAPTVELAAIGGYEDNRFFTTRERGATYGVAVQWIPSNRTRADAIWEHRFFGSSYRALLDHRTPLSVWSIQASREITSYPQQLANFPVGGEVNVLLNSLFASRVQDPLQRQTFVNNFIRQRGLPLQLAGPLDLFTQQITLVEAQAAMFGLIGARNSVFLSIYHNRSEPVESAANAGVTPLLDFLTHATQVGTSAVWNHRLTSNSNLQTTLSWSRTTEIETGNGVTNQYGLQTQLSRPLSDLTSVHVGARFQHVRSNISNDYSEFAVFAGINHTYR
jgi:uncharacterized protein (PEP-CTERM system associated)